MMRDKLTVGIGFHTRTLPALQPLVSMYRFCNEAVCPHTAYQIVMGGQTALQTVFCPVLGTITKKSIGPIPIPPNTGKYWPIPQYPNTGIIRTLVVVTCDTEFRGIK